MRLLFTAHDEPHTHKAHRDPVPEVPVGDVGHTLVRTAGMSGGFPLSEEAGTSSAIRRRTPRFAAVASRVTRPMRDARG